MFTFVFKVVFLFSKRYASRISAITKSTDKLKNSQETSIQIRPRIKSLSKESPPEMEQVNNGYNVLL